MRKLQLALAAALLLGLSGCGYNTFQTTDKQIKASWSGVVNQYQRRADLVLVNTSLGEANFEQSTLTEVIEARARATSIQAVQGELSGALSQLLVVSENYRILSANQGLRDLQAQLEGTENWIIVARNRPPKSTAGAP